MRLGRTTTVWPFAIGISVLVIGARLFLWWLSPCKQGSPAIVLGSFVRPDPARIDWRNLDLNYLTRFGTQPSRASFGVYNPTTRPLWLDLGRAMADVEVIGADSRVYVSNAILGRFSVGPKIYLRPGRTNGSVRILVPPGAKACRFRISYWPATCQDRWDLWCANSEFVRQHPGVFWNWLSKGLPATPPWTKGAACEVSFPTVAER